MGIINLEFVRRITCSSVDIVNLEYQIASKTDEVSNMELLKFSALHFVKFVLKIKIQRFQALNLL